MTTISVAESQTFLLVKRPQRRRARRNGCFCRVIPVSSEFLSPSVGGAGGGGEGYSILGKRKLVVYVDIAVVAIFDFITGRLELVEMVNMVLLRAKTLTHLKKMSVPQAMGGGEGWVMAILYCKPSLL